jgi:hypothetical protein
LIVGTGAGGCVKGALRAGYNVIGVENDERQYNALYSEMNSWIASMQKEKEEAKTAPPKAKRAPKTTAAVDDDDEDDGVVPLTITSVSAAVVEGKCFSCDEPGTAEDPLGECINCEKQNHVKACMTDYNNEEGVKEGLVCGGCNKGMFGDV